MKLPAHISSILPLRGLGGLFLVCCLLFAGCGDKNNPYIPEPEPPVTPPAEKENIVFNLDGNLIRAGKTTAGDAVFNIDGNYIRAGEKATGDVVFNIDGKLIRAGEKKSGDVVFNIDGDYIRAGEKADGDIVFNRDGVFVRGGEGETTMNIYKIDFEYGYEDGNYHAYLKNAT
ncbi:hypothetical protein, partial [Dysgonomonas sp. UBA7710]